MKKRSFLFLLAAAALLCFAGYAAQPPEPVLCLGLNAEITEIDAAEHILYVTDPGKSGSDTFGARCAVDCGRAIEAGNLFYVKYGDSHNVTAIRFEDLTVGDRIILGVYDSELSNAPSGPVTAEQIQLGTQRLP